MLERWLFQADLRDERLDKVGYNREGYDKDGYSRVGYDKRGFNKEHLHNETKTKFDAEGYDYENYDKDGYGRYTHRQRNQEELDSEYLKGRLESIPDWRDSY